MPQELQQNTTYEERFGNIAIAKEFITPEELLSALRIQVQEETEKKQHRLIGQILLEQGVISGEQIQQVMSELFKDGDEDLR